MSEDTRPIDPITDPLLQPGPWRVDFGTWKMAEFMAWDMACRSGQLVAITGMMAKVIKAWPYAGDPADPQTYAQLSAVEWRKATHEVGLAVGALFQ